MRTTPAFRALPAALFIMVAVSCGQETQQTPRTVQVTSPVLTFGAADGDEAYLFTLIRSVVRTADGAIVVADQTPRVAMFAADGTWRRDLGLRGRGPGELQLPAGLWLHAEDTVAVWDALQRKIVMYPLADGRPREVAVRWGSPSRPVDGAGGRTIIELEAGQLMDTARAHSRLVALSGGDSLTIVGPYDVPEIGWVVEENGIGHMVSPPVFQTYPVWEVTASGVWWADPSSNTIRKTDWSGQEIDAVHLPEHRRHVISDDDRDAFYEGLAARYGVDRPEGDDEPFADTAPDVTAIVADDHGLLWLAGFDPGADPLRGWIGSEYTVLDAADDRVHTTVTFPDGFTLTDVAAGLAIGFHEDDTGIHFVHVYDVGAVYDDRPAARASQ